MLVCRWLLFFAQALFFRDRAAAGNDAVISYHDPFGPSLTTLIGSRMESEADLLEIVGDLGVR